jgi:hypothetical protein
MRSVVASAKAGQARAEANLSIYPALADRYKPLVEADAGKQSTPPLSLRKNRLKPM